ncbi:uncharacterized protein TM35_000641290, partial [Trypanosoma theileri]
PSGRGVSRGAVEVSCGAGGALRVRPAAESEWLTCGAGSRVSACGKYADLCRQHTARRATTTTIATTVAAGQPKAVMAVFNGSFFGGYYEVPSGSGTVSRQSGGGSGNDNHGQEVLGDQERKTESELGPSAPAGTGRESMAQKDGEGAE